MNTEAIELYKTRLSTLKKRLIKKSNDISLTIEKGDFEKAIEYSNKIEIINSRINENIKSLDLELKKEGLRTKKDETLIDVKDKIEIQRDRVIEAIISYARYKTDKILIIDANRRYVELKHLQNKAVIGFKGDLNCKFETHSRAYSSKAWKHEDDTGFQNIDFENCKIKVIKGNVYLQNEVISMRYVLKSVDECDLKGDF